jgi:hypothetical protein
VNKAEAIEIARIECEKRGLPWDEPVHASWGPVYYLVSTKVGYRGGKYLHEDSPPVRRGMWRLDCATVKSLGQGEL